MALSSYELKQKLRSGEYTVSKPTLSKSETVKQNLKNGTYTFGVDDSFIQSLVSDSNKYIKEVNDYQNNKTYQGVKDRYGTIDSAGGDLIARADKVLAYIGANGNRLDPSARDYLQEMATNIKLGVNEDKRSRKADYDVISQYATEEDYNDAVFKAQYSNASFDEIVEQRERINTIIGNKSEEEAEKYRKQVSILNDLLYNSNYTDKESYQKAIADVDSRISNINKELEQINSTKEKGLVAGSLWENENGSRVKELEAELSTLETTKAQLTDRSKLAEFTEMPTKLGSDNMAVFKANYGKYIQNPSGDELVAAFEKYDAIPTDNVEEREAFYYEQIPEIQDPLNFYLENKDLDGQYHQSSSIGKYIGNMMFRAKDYHWDEISDDEKLIYEYTLAREGKDKALEYLSLIEPQFGQRYQAKLEGKIAELGTLSKIGLNVVSVPMKMIGGVFGAADNLSDYVAESKVNPYSQSNHLRIGTNAIRSETAESIASSSNLEIAGRNVLAEAYNIGMSTADSMVGAKALGPAYSVIAGMGAAADASEDIYDRGGTTDQVFWGGFAAGAAEMVFEYVSIDKLLTNSAAVDTAKGYFKNVVKQAGIEASEEALTEISNKVFDNLIMDEKSAFSLRVKELVDDGMSVQEAQEQAVTEQIYDVIWAAVAGGVSGGTGAAVFGGGALYSNTKVNISHGANLKKDEDRVSGLFKYAESIKDNSTVKGILKHNTVDNISDKNLGRLYNALVSDIQSRFSNAKTVDEVKQTFKDVVNMDRDYVLQNVAREYAADRYKEITPIGENDTSFIQEELTSSLLGRMEEAYTDLNTHQGQLLADLPQNVLVKASQIAQGGNGVKAADIGIDPQSQYYKNLESAGLADSEGIISGDAIMAEVSRRAEKEGANKHGEPEQGGFTDAPDKDVLRERSVHDEAFNFATGVYRSPRMMQAESVAKLFGVKLWWDEKLTSPYYNFETHCIFMNPKMAISDMYAVIFKHELVHHFELKKGYDGFKNYLFKNSPAFAQYCYDSLETVNDAAFDGTYEEAIKAYTQFKYEQYKNSTEIPEGLRERFTVEMAEMEIVADFVGERLLFGKNVDKSMEALTEVAKTDRNLFQRIWDWINDKLKALKKRGDVQDRSLTKDLEYLNDRLKRVWDSKDKKNSDTGTESKYKIEIDVNGNKYVNVDSGQIVESDGKSIARVIADIISLKFKNLIDVSGQKIRINQTTNREFRESESARGQRKNSVEMYTDKLQTIFNADEILKAAKDWVGQALKHTRKDDIVEFAKAEIWYKVGENGYSADVVVGTKRDGSAILYDIVDIIPQKITESSVAKEDKNPLRRQDDSVTDEIVSQSDENVKHYLGFNKDGEVDFVAPKKPSVNDRADRLTKRFGRYETGVNGLKEDLTKLLEMANDNDITGAAKLAQEMSTRFKGVDGNAVNADAVLRNLNNAVISKQIEYRVYRGLRHIEKDNRSLRAKLELSDKRIAQLEGKEFDSHRYHEQMEKKRLDREDRAKNLKHFHSIYNRLNTRLEGNTDVKHIPEHLKEVVRAFLNTFKIGNVEVDSKWQRRRLTSQNLAELSKQYEFAENDSNGTPNMAYDESVKEFIDSLYDKASKSEKGLLTQDLDAYEILMLSNVADNLMQMVRLAEETFREGKAIKFQDLSEPCIKELKACKDQKEMRNKLAGWMRNLTSGNMTPPYFFKMLGEGFYKLYNDIVEGQGKWALHFNAAKSFVEKIQQKYNYSKWNAETVVLKTERGDNIKLTIEQAMQLYATVKRQLSNRKQDAQHLNIGGIVLEDSISSSNWRKIKSDLEAINNDSKLDDDEKQSKTKRIWDAFHDKCDNAAMQLSIKDLMFVGELLNEEQKSYTEAWVNYLSNNMAALGNETSLLLFGYEKFTESNYIPYNSAENYLYSQPGAVKGDERLKHLSFTKTTQKKAATPLVLSSLSEVCAAHVDKMCMYNAMAIPLENLNKVFNCTLYDEIGTPTENIKKEIERAFGADAIDYLKQFIEDANGKVRNSSDDSVADVWISRYKKGAVLASMSVVVQQPSAMFRAMVYIPPKYFMRLKDVKGFGKNYEQCCKYAPVALIKQMGRFDTGLGVSNTKWLLGQETLMDKIDDKLSLPASKADEMTWSHIWTAVKAMVADTTSLNVNSEEFLQHCGKVFTEVINLTQVYDSTLVKSQHMRSKSAYMKMLTSFMAEPTVTYNILADMCYRTFNRITWKSGLKFSAKAGTAVLTSTLVNVLMKSLVYAMRDDDEDKTFWEKYLKEISESFKQEANPLELIPFIRDIWSLIQGYDVERADMTMFDELISAFETVGSENKTFGEKVEAIAGSLANLFGVPVKNIVRDIKSIINLVSELFDTDQNSAVGMKYAFIEGWTGESSNASYYGRMAEAVEDGDEETYDELFDLMLENGVEENDIISGVKSAIKKSDAVKDETDNYVKKVSDNSTYKMLDEEDQKKFASKIKEVLCVQILDDMIAGDDAKYDELYEAKRNSSKRYTRLKKELLNKGVSKSDIDFNLFLAEIRYVENQGIDIHEWALAELAKSKKYADTDASGGVSKKEARQAIENMDLDKQTKKDLWSYYGID